MIPSGLDDLLTSGLGRVVALTGAGVSAASGIPTFRGSGGLYNGVSVADLATPAGFNRNPQLVWEWYAYRIGLVRNADPNPAHHALAKWASIAQDFVLITTNVDDLHERAGSPSVLHLHGKILEGRCTESGRSISLPDPLSLDEGLPSSPEGHPLRPNVVWFGEKPWAEAYYGFHQAIAKADLFVEAGHSGAVHYGFSDLAVRGGIRVLRINPERGHLDRQPQVTHWMTPAEEALPALVETLSLAKASQKGPDSGVKPPE